MAERAPLRPVLSRQSVVDTFTIAGICPVYHARVAAVCARPRLAVCCEVRVKRRRGLANPRDRRKKLRKQ